MRERWQTVSDLWECNKAAANKLDILERLDYYGNFSWQLEWQLDRGARPVRVVYTSSGAPTAALLHDNYALVDYTLFWIDCRDVYEANYLLAIINSDALATAVNKYTVANWAGNTRHLQKHLWKLSIPEFDSHIDLHIDISDAGEKAATGAAKRLARLHEERDKVTVAIARRELRKWLRESPEGHAVETAVKRLLGGPARPAATKGPVTGMGG